jgi:DNA-binding winged helix-turn-helix (wHTH) protein/serine/threonine protein kinase
MPFEGVTAGNGPAGARIWRFGECEFDELKRELRVQGQPVDLESKPLDLLLQLLLHAGEVVTKDELLEAVWPGTAVVDGSLATAISKLRRALGDTHEDAIVTLPRLGYKFALPVHSRAAASGRQPELTLRPGDAVPGRDQWRLKHQLAGAADVWLAEHTKTKQQRVFKFAPDGLRLKALKREVTLHRYMTETIADHSFLAPLMEWNFETPPFFVESEFAGRNLQEYAEDVGGLRTIPLEERLRWMIEIASAVGQAHDVGVLHKDIKPTNILLYQAEGQPAQIRLADFGSAALLDPSVLGDLGITNHGFPTEGSQDSAISGTLLYLAPELLAGQSATASADIYSLGVLLYQLVLGDFRMPLTPGWETGIADPLLRQDIAEAACGELAQRMKSAAELAERLSSLEERRTRQNKLDAMQARAERAERAVADARARRPWIIAACAALALGACLSFSLYLRAVHERDHANRQTAIAASINQFLAEDLLGRGNPFQTGKAQESLVDAVKHAAPAIDAQFKNEPQIAGRLHLTIARSLDGRTSYSDARGEYMRAAELARQAQGDLAQEAILADLQRAAMEARAYQKDLMPEARTLLADQEKRLAQLPSPPGDLLVWRDSAKGMIALIDNDISAAAQSFQAALDRSATLSDFDETARLNLQQRLAFTFIRRGDGVNAEKLFKQLIVSHTRLEGPNGPNVLRSRLNLAQAYMIQNRHEETTAIYPALVAGLGPDHEITMQALTTRAQSEGSLGRWEDAIRDDLSIYRIAVAKQGPLSFFAIATLSDASLAQCRANHYVDGSLSARKSYEAARQAFGPKAGLTGGRLTLWPQLGDASALLDSIDTKAVAQLAGIPDWGANVSLARAQILFKLGQYSNSRIHLQQAQPVFERADAEPYQQEASRRLDAALKRYSQN